MRHEERIHPEPGPEGGPTNYIYRGPAGVISWIALDADGTESKLKVHRILVDGKSAFDNQPGFPWSVFCYGGFMALNIGFRIRSGSNIVVENGARVSLDLHVEV